MEPTDLTPQAVPHFCVSISRHILNCAERGVELRNSQVALLYLLWSCVRNPFAAQPQVHMSYAFGALMLRSTPAYIGRLTRELVAAGLVRKTKSIPGRGTGYILLRPKHLDGDAQLSPFWPAADESAAEAAAKLLREDGQVVAPNRRAKKAAVKKPKVKPSSIAIALENMAGFEPVYAEKLGRGGKKVRRATLPFSSRCGEWSAVRAAQTYIAEHGAAKFKRVCAAAVARGEFFPTLEERARLFEHPDLVAELLAEPRVTQGSEPAEAAAEVPAAELTIGERYPPEKVRKFLKGRAPDEAEAVYAEHAEAINGMTLKGLTTLLTAWQDGEKRSLASVFEALSPVAVRT